MKRGEQPLTQFEGVTDLLIVRMTGGKRRYRRRSSLEDASNVPRFAPVVPVGAGLAF